MKHVSKEGKVVVHLIKVLLEMLMVIILMDSNMLVNRSIIALKVTPKYEIIIIYVSFLPFD